MAYSDPKKQAAAARKHYLANKSKIQARARIYSDAQRNRLRDLLIQIKKAGKCADCGFADYRAMDFHHLHDKRTEIATAVSRSWSLDGLLKEIAKCVMLCANCHRIRHHKST